MEAQTKVHSTSSVSTTCQNCKKDFTIEPEDFNFYEKIKVPPPTFCPECRFQRRLMFRNERSLYRIKCDLCKKSILSTFSKDSSRTIYCQSCWWSDKWNPLNYGLEYNSKKPFFEQLGYLLHKIPLVALGNNYPTLVNSEYVNETGYAKNCYLIFDADYCENVLYSSRLSLIKDSMDVLNCRESELCYESVNCRKSSRIFFSEDISDCVNVFFSKNLAGCMDCFGCVNLRNKNCHIWNKPYSREKYNKKLEILKQEILTREGIERLRAKTLGVWCSVPHKFMHGFQNVNVSGDYIYESRNTKNSFQVRGTEDSKFCQLIKDGGVKNAYDYTIWGNNAELVYECMNVGMGIHNTRFCYVCALGNTLDVEYCVWCLDVMNTFGCSGVRNKKYCILNRQYKEEKFYSLRLQIIKDMEKNPYVDKRGRVHGYGEFFPYDLSPYRYNETDAQVYFPISKEDAISAGWKWRNQTLPEYKTTMDGNRLPITTNEVTNEILREIIACVSCGKAYRFTPSELVFLRRFRLPLSDKCFECRYKRRFERLNPLKLWHRHCMKPGCLNEFETSYAPDRPEIVYCERCYNQEVY